MPDLGREYDVSRLTADDLLQQERDLRVGLAFAAAGSPVRDIMNKQLRAVKDNLDSLERGQSVR